MTIGALLPLYRDLLALHVFSVIVWISGMVVLPVVYLHHRALPTTSEGVRAFIALERQIFKRLVNPSMFATWTFGILLILTPGAISWRAPWWLAKFVAVLVLSGHHGVLSVWRRHLRDGRLPSVIALRLGLFATFVIVALIVAMVMIQP
jgi:protoporphyrinogen IX oxidase